MNNHKLTTQGQIALRRAIEQACDPYDGWTTVGTCAHQNVVFYDDTDDLPLSAYEEADTALSYGWVQPHLLDDRVCVVCERGKHSEGHRDECVGYTDDD